MKADNQVDRAVYIPPQLLAAAQEAAKEENRPIADLVSDAIQFYLLRIKPEAARPSKSTLPAGENLDSKRSIDEEKARSFETWARSHPRTPPLSDDAVRRENLIRDAW